MNKKKTPNNIEDLLSLFSETLTPADVLSAKLMAQFSNAITSERLNLNMSQKDFAKHINAFPVGNVETTIFQLIKLLKLQPN